MELYSVNSLIAGLTEQAEIHARLAVQLTQKTPRTTKSGKPYLEVQVSDPGGTLAIRVWETLPWYPEFCAADVNATFMVSALWRQTSFGPDPTDLTLRPLTPQEEEAMLAGSEELRELQQRNWEAITRLCSTIEDSRFATLCRSFLEQYEGRFRRAAAARGYHHARRGGLVEHTAGVMRTAAALCESYPELNRDLLLTGALLHDCGKMWENGYAEHTLTMAYTDVGELLGHITLGIEVVNRLWNSVCTETRRKEWESLCPATEQARLHLLHLIASHHGSLEYGSPVPPKTPEAFALNHVDDLDAKLEMMRGAYKTSPFLSTHIRQRKAPLPGNVADPLPRVSPTSSSSS